MKASEAGLLTFIQKSSQFVIPIYQRAYSWTERECRQLWDDIIRTGTNEAVSVHFVGSIVYIEAELSQVIARSPLLVIDGQQRLTTTTLLLAALAEAVGEDEPIDGFSRAKIKNRYLIDPDETDQRRFKLMLSETDKATLLNLLDGEPAPEEPSIRLTENFAFFREQLRKADLKTVCRGLQKLVVVDISLMRGMDNPQLIFESMNSTGRELSQADLIRNFVLMGLEPTLQERLYRHYWRPMELEFGQEAYGTTFDSFMRHFLTLKLGEIPKLDQVFEQFKVYAGKPETAAAGVEALVSELRTYASHYCAMALGHERDRALARVFKDLRELKVDVAYPFLLALYADHKEGMLVSAELEEIIRMVEAYVFRRAICGIPTNSMNKTFATFARALRKDAYLDSVKAHFLTLPSYRRFPRNEEFRRDIKVRDLYNFRSRSYWLRRMENHDRKELVAVEEYTIEHIMPQNPELPRQWRADLGEDWRETHQRCLHTLGNLTLTGYNSEYGDRPFNEKCEMEGGLRSSPLKLNAGLGTVEVWNEAAIGARADRLSKRALDVWRMPQLDDETLEKFRQTATPEGRYTRGDHPHLSDGTVGALFDELRKRVLALDPCVYEEYLKLYVAYKAETNFVDVVPQASGLRLSLNMKFAELDDPHGMSTDVSGKGRWGNGEVELKLTRSEEIPYATGLIRQSLETQLGPADEA